MQYENDYNPIKWQDEVVDENGNVILEGTLYDENNMNRMEAGIDLHNTYNAFIAELARQIRSNQLELEKWQKQRIQEGVVEINNADTNIYFRDSDPYAIVALEGYTQLDSPEFSVLTEIVEGDPGLVGDVVVYDKSSNGFKIKYTGSADYVKIRWSLVNPDV
ncbi:MAG: hypothetical protein PWR10_1527 [Halanaerobiales bacterium]|nr:hypothetical protein [Halanaerobiales bacterium]